MDKVRVAVIGVGHLGQHHARIFSEMEAAELVGICDKNKKQCAKIAKKCGTNAFGDISELPPVDAVTIAVPTTAHCEVAGYFLSKGIHSLVEKPITLNVGEADQLIRLANQNKIILRVGHVERYNAAVRAVRSIVSNPLFIECHRLSPFPERSLDVGVVLDLMIHDLDIIMSIVQSPILKMDSVGASVVTKHEDICNSRIEFENGCVANVTASRIAYKPMRKIRIFQSDAYISLDYFRQNYVIYRKKKGVQGIEGIKDIKRIRPKIKKVEPLRLELESFLHAIQPGYCKERVDDGVSGEAGKAALVAALKILKEMRLNQENHE